MKQFRKLANPLLIFFVMAFSSGFNIASAQNDNYNDDENYSNNNDYDADANNYEEQPSTVNINTFNDALAPYGSWVFSPAYGRCWVPRYNGFVPYSTGGHWIYSSYGWTWASSYSWGWAPFHYGRWAYDPIYGWMWVPGYEWGPAWVTWRSGGGYYGWTPLTPGMSVGINIGIGVPYTRWVFAPCRYMGYSNINKHYVRPSHNTTVINNTTIINNTTVYNNRKFVAGPNRTEVERYRGRPVNQVRVVNASNAGRTVVNNNTVKMYRPGVQQKAVRALGQQNNTSANNQLRGQTLNNNNQANNNNQRQAQLNNRNRQQSNMPAPDQRDIINNNRQQTNQPDANYGRRDSHKMQQEQQQNNNTQSGNQQGNDQRNLRGRQNDVLRQQQHQIPQQQREQRMENNQRINQLRQQGSSEWKNNIQQRMNRQQPDQQQPVHKQEGGNGNGRNRKP